MLDRLRSVMKNKNRVQREHKQRRVDEISEMKADSIFKAKLATDLKLISLILMDDNIENVEIEAGQENINRLDSAMYSSEMAEFNVVKQGERYFISSKELSF